MQKTGVGFLHLRRISMETITEPLPDERWRALYGIENYQQYLENKGKHVTTFQQLILALAQHGYLTV